MGQVLAIRDSSECTVKASMLVTKFKHLFHCILEPNLVDDLAVGWMQKALIINSGAF